MLRGYICILLACVFWALIFVVPLYLEGFTPMEVALGRYFFFGLISLCLLFIRKIWRKYPLAIWLRALGFALLANVVYYTFLVMGVKNSSAALAALILGCSPITISFAGSWKDKKANMSRLIVPSLAIFFGLLMVNHELLDWTEPASTNDYLFGLCCSAMSLLIWTWYVIKNAAFLKRHPEVTISDWTTVIGVATFVWVVILGVIIGFISDSEEVRPDKFAYNSETAEELTLFIIGNLCLAIASSWGGFYFWNRATKYLSLTLAGQLSVFETIFGLILVFFVEERVPLSLELAGILIMLIGVIVAGLSAARKST